MQSRRCPNAQCLLLLLAAVVGTVATMQPPAPIRSDSFPTLFSAERAMRHVREIARAPHPLNSAAHERARDYIAAEFRALGYETQIQKAVARRDLSYGVKVAGVENIVAYPAGKRRSGRVLLLTAHYDSHNTGSGAGDDAAGVATLLETARVLRDAPPPAADAPEIAFLVTDAEEMGLMGATAFVQNIDTFEEGRFEPKPNDIIVLNFEGRGGGGPTFMFETSENNLWLIRALSAAPRPLASSLMYDLYKTLPNDTDLTVFKEAGMRGMNFAFADRWTHYHTSLDIPDGLDLRSLQHHGSYATALTQRLSAHWPPSTPRAAVYFDLLSRFLVWYPSELIWPLTALTLVVFAAALWKVKGEAEAAKSLATGFLLFPLTLAAGGVVAYGMVRLMEPVRAGTPYGDTYAPRWFEASLFAFVVAAALLLWLPILRRFSARALYGGALLWWVVALVAASALLPGATYLFLWPLVFALVPLCLQRETPLISALCALPCIVLFVPILHSLCLLLGFGMPAALGILGAFALAPLLPALRGSENLHLWPVVALVVFGAFCFSAGNFLSHGPRMNSLVFLQDADAKTALWATPNPTSDVWLRPFVGPDAKPLPKRTFAPWDNAAYRFADAAPLDLSAPILARSGDTLTIRSPRRVHEIFVTSDTAIRGAIFAGRPVKLHNGLLRFRYLNPPPDGFSLKLDAAPGVRLILTSVTNELPAVVPPRPSSFLAEPNTAFGDAALIRRALTW